MPGDARKDHVGERARDDLAFLRDNPRIGGSAFGYETIGRDQPGVINALRLRFCLGQRLREKADRFDVAADQRMSGTLMTRVPLRAAGVSISGRFSA